MKRLLYILVSFVLLSSCETQKSVLYLQNTQYNTNYRITSGGEIRLQPDDMVSIVVSSKNPELASVFNMVAVSPVTASGEDVSNSLNGSNVGSQNRVLCYTVDPDGEIEYPVLGKIKVAGFTQFELSAMIQQMIADSEMIKDPIVTVQFVNLSFSTLGEVNAPGNYIITKDKITIFEALSMSGDLTISGVRDNVSVIRNTNGVLKTYKLDLKSTDIYTSPAFYIHQNDVIYVEPNKYKANQSSVNASTFSSPTFWLSLMSFMLTITLLIVNYY
ncbi:MAG: polysaccharide biosynthesis/export family protein [Rikenellaceae bacterium]